MRKFIVFLVIAIAAVWLYFSWSAKPDPLLLEQQRLGNIERYYSSPARIPDFVAPGREPCAEHNSLRNPYFGSLHVHTALSADAYAFDTRVSPDEAYAFARGGSVLLPPLDGDGRGTRELRNPRPVDFTAVTDHAEYLGEQQLCLDPASAAYGALVCRVFRGSLELPVSDTMKPLLRMVSFMLSGKQRPAAVCGADGRACIEASDIGWQQIQRAAEHWYDRSSDCAFTTFVGYEYSLAEQAGNLHRNVIFATAAVPPLPLSAREAQRPQELWQWLRQQCQLGASGCDVLAIPHNSNWSSGRMFHPGMFSVESGASEDERRALAQLRGDIERLAEVMQVKGDSECRQGLQGVIGSADEFCDFEKLRLPAEVVEDCGDGVGSGGMMLKGCLSRYAYTRYGLIEGLAQQQQLGVNPFKYGLIADMDTHNGTPGAVSEVDNSGAHGMDATPELRLITEYDVPGGIAKGSPVRYNPGGLAGAWAEENSRESLFAAFKRRETFGTSGPRIVPRLFAGWQFDASLCDSADLVAQGYADGVPMGGDLPPAPQPGLAPVFVASALRDAGDDGAPLQRIQIIKGWVDDDGVMHQDIIDIAGGDNDASVDTATCARKGGGHASLCGVWRDPDFDPSRRALYYARVLENPSCRWSSWECNRLPAAARPAACTDAGIPKTVQERAWTSPIWYTPTMEKPGTRSDPAPGL